MAALRAKLRRDLWHLRTQLLAVAVVSACGVSVFVALRSMHDHLRASQRRYYADYAFADLFAPLVRAPQAAAGELQRLPGVAVAEPRLVYDVTVDVPGLSEPAVARLVALPNVGPPLLNRLHLRQGRLPERDDEVVASDAFAAGNGLRAGDSLTAILNGRRQTLRIVGRALSPEFIYEVRGLTEIFPDSRRFGVLWIRRRGLEAAFGMQGAFNDVTLTLAPGADDAAVLAAVDHVLAPYGGVGAFGRDDHLSHRFIADEIQETRVTSVVIPAIFLGVAAFLLHVVITRLVGTQRDQIAVLKAFGYSDGAIGRHFLALALAPVLTGTLGGLALGVWMAGGLSRIYARFFQLPVLRYVQDPGVLALAGAIALAAAVIGALGAVRAATRLQPAEAMRPEAPGRFRLGPLERLGWGRRLPLAARIIVRNLARRPIKAGLAVLGVALAVAIGMVGWFTFDAVDRIKEVQFREAQREDLTLTFAQPRSAGVRYALARLPGVTRVEPFRVVAVHLRRGPRMERAAIQGLSGDAQLRRAVDGRGRVHPLPQRGLLLSTMLAERLGAAPGDTVLVEVLEGSRPSRPVLVAGTVDDMLGLSAYMELEALHRLLREGGSVSGAFLAVLPEARAPLYTRLKRLAAVSGVAVRLAFIAGFERTIAESFSLSVSLMIVFGSVITGGVVYNGARIALSERARELASLRILGFSRGEVASMLLGEQALLTAIAIPTGLLIGYGLCALLALRFGSELFRLPLVVSGRTYLTATAVVVVAAVLSALLVRRRVFRLDLVAVLKTRE